MKPPLCVFTEAAKEEAARLQARWIKEQLRALPCSEEEQKELLQTLLRDIKETS